MKKKSRYATERIRNLRTRATCSDYISILDEFDPVVLYGRVSSPTQKENLPHLLTNLEWEVKKRGNRVVAVVGEIASGEDWGRAGFDRAVLIAKAAKAVIVTECVDRFLRVRKYRSKSYTRPSVFDMKNLIAEADGVQLATVVHPDASDSEVRSYQRKRGQAGTGNYGGRPDEEFPVKAKRVRLGPKAIALREEGKSYREIGLLLKVHWSTIREWTKAHRKIAHLPTMAE